MPITKIKGHDIETSTFEEKVETAVTSGSVKDDVVNITGDTMTGTLGVPEINITSVNPADTATLFGTDDNGDSTFHVRIGNGSGDKIQFESWDGSAATSLMEIHQDTVNITGNLTVSGTTTTINSETLEVGDNFIVLNSGVTGDPVLDAGLRVERGNQDDAEFKWNETEDKWESSNGLIVGGDIIGSNLKSSNGSTYIAINDDDTVEVYTSATKWLTIDEYGRLGIGKEPTTKLDVDGSIFGVEEIASIYNNDNTRYGYFSVRRSDRTRGAYFGWGNGGSQVEIYLDNATIFKIFGGTSGRFMKYLDQNTVNFRINSGASNTDWKASGESNGTISFGVWSTNFYIYWRDGNGDYKYWATSGTII